MTQGQESKLAYTRSEIARQMAEGILEEHGIRDCHVVTHITNDSRVALVDIFNNSPVLRRFAAKIPRPKRTPIKEKQCAQQVSVASFVDNQDGTRIRVAVNAYTRPNEVRQARDIAVFVSNETPILLYEDEARVSNGYTSYPVSDGFLERTISYLDRLRLKAGTEPTTLESVPITVPEISYQSSMPPLASYYNQGK